MSFETVIALAGLAIIASYCIYLVFFWWAFRVWKKGNARRAGMIVAATLGVALGIPAFDHWKDGYDRSLLRRAEIRADHIDFVKKRILMIGRSCGESCKQMLHRTGAELTLVRPTSTQFSTFVQTDQFPADTQTHRISLSKNSRLRTDEMPVAVPTLDNFDLVIINRGRPGWTEHFRQDVPWIVSHKNVLVWQFVAKVDPAKTFAELQPDILVMIQRDQTFMFPFHPFLLDRARGFNFDEFRSYLSDLYCKSDYAQQASSTCRKRALGA